MFKQNFKRTEQLRKYILASKIFLSTVCWDSDKVQNMKQTNKQTKQKQKQKNKKQNKKQTNKQITKSKEAYKIKPVLPKIDKCILKTYFKGTLMGPLLVLVSLCLGKM